MTNLRKIWLASAILALGIAQPVAAVTIIDNYVGSDDHGYGDVIGQESLFDIASMDVTRAGNTLTVSINTNFAGLGDNGLFSNITGGKGIGYGDLFLSSSWDPYGPAPYLGDDNKSGTIWQYAFNLDNRWMNEASAGTGTLYSLNSGNNNANALLSDDFITGGTFRNGQEIAVDTASDITAIAGSSNWNIDAAQKRINFTIDLTGTTLAGASEIALHWGMSCGNDTIEGVVPAPAILLIMALGLSGIGVSSVVRKRKFA